MGKRQSQMRSDETKMVTDGRGMAKRRKKMRMGRRWRKDGNRLKTYRYHDDTLELSELCHICRHVKASLPGHDIFFSTPYLGPKLGTFQLPLYCQVYWPGLIYLLQEIVRNG